MSSAANWQELPHKLREYADRTMGYIYADEVFVLRAAADEIDRLREKVNRPGEYDLFDPKEAS